MTTTFERRYERRDTAANWTSTNPILAAGELGFDTTNKVLKIGDGTTAWNSLGAANSFTYAPLSAGTFSAYTPAWTSTGTQPAVGNGSIVGAYSQVGKTVNYNIVLTLGSTSTVGTGIYFFSLPVARGGTIGLGMGWVFAQDSSGGLVFLGMAANDSATTIAVRMVNDAATLLSATTPFVPADTDVFRINGTYQAA